MSLPRHAARALNCLSCIGLLLGTPAATSEVEPVERAEPESVVLRLGTGTAQEFEPCLALGADGHLWAAWLEWTPESVELYTAWIADGVLLGRSRIASGLTAPAAPMVAALPAGPGPGGQGAGGGALVVLEEGPVGARRLVAFPLVLADGELLAPAPEVLAPPGHGRLFPTGAAVEGSVEVVWQELDGRDYDLYWARREGGAWSEPRPVLDTPEDEWRPRASAVPAGARGSGLDVVFDRFSEGTYGVHHLRLVDGQPIGGGPLSEVAPGAAHAGLPELVRTPAGELFVAWEQAPDFGRDGALRRPPRGIGLALLGTDGELRWRGFVPAPAKRRCDHPRPLAWAGGLGVLWREPVKLPDASRTNQGTYHYWETRWRALDTSGRSIGEPATLAGSAGEEEGTETVLAGADGELWCTFAADDRDVSMLERDPWRASLAGELRVGLRKLRRPDRPGQPEQDGRQGALDAPANAPAADAPPHPGLWPDQPPPTLALPHRIEPVPAEQPTGAPRLLLGDLHRHTQLSRCQGLRDGTTLDAYRYARGPGLLDFIAISDHIQHMTPFDWWRSVRDADRFHAPGSLVVLPANERMLKGHGHSNAIYATSRRGSRDLEPELVPEGALPEDMLLIPHMTGIGGNGFDWSAFLPEFHRLIEVYQGARGSYEGAGSPLSAADASPRGATLAEGLALGAEFGLIASSDHGSTATSYAGVWVAPGTEPVTRAVLFDALRARRTFAATAPLRIDARLGELDLGAAGPAPRGAPFTVRARGPAPVASVEVLKNGEPFARAPRLPRSRAGTAPMDELFVLSTRLEFLSEEIPLDLRVEGGELLSARVRRPSEQGGEVLLGEDGGLRLSRGVTDWTDVAFTVHWTRPRRHRVVIRVRERESTVTAGALEPGQATWFPGPRRSEQLWRVGPSLGAAQVNLEFPDPGRAPGDVYYARITFEDGNLAWTSPIRVTELTDDD